MSEILIGLISAGVGACLFVGGFYFGKTFHPRTIAAKQTEQKLEELAESERLRLQEENEAFQKLMDFNVDQIYGAGLKRE